jgi:glycosyltransferase involved in cell wall biosynthesis
MAHIGDTQSSVYQQTYRPIELVVVDNQSNDGTSEFLRSWCASCFSKDFAITLLTNDVRGASSSRNMGMAYCNGTYIQFLDHDDLLHRQKLELQVEKAGQTGADLVIARNTEFRKLSDVHEILASPANLQSDLPIPVPYFSRMRWSHLGWFVRRDLMLRAGPWNEKLRLSDYEMDVRLKLNARNVAYVSAVLSFWRVSNPTSESKSPASQMLAWRNDVALEIVRALRLRQIRNPAEYHYMARYAARTAVRCGRAGLMTEMLRGGAIAARCVGSAVTSRLVAEAHRRQA